MLSKPRCEISQVRSSLIDATIVEVTRNGFDIHHLPAVSRVIDDNKTLYNKYIR